MVWVGQGALVFGHSWCLGDSDVGGGGGRVLWGWCLCTESVGTPVLVANAEAGP